MTPNSLLARNLGTTLETARRLLYGVHERLQATDTLMRRSDWRFALGDIEVIPAVNLWENWLSGKKDEVEVVLGRVLNLAIEMAGADFGNIQLFDPAKGGLRIVASRGLDAEFLDYFKVVRGSESACGVALQEHRRLIVSDVRTDTSFNVESREIMLRAEALSVQSTPLISPCGSLLGVLSTHYRSTGTLPTASLPFPDRLARRTAKLLISARG